MYKLGAFEFLEASEVYEVKYIRGKWLLHEGISKILFLDHFSP